MDIKYAVTATLNGEDISMELNESLFADLVQKHGPFKGLAQKIANHINENKDAMLISQLEAKRDKKLSKAQKELVAEVVALMQAGDDVQEPSTDDVQEDTQDETDEVGADTQDENETPEDSTDDDSEGTEEQPESSDDEDADTDEVLNDALADEYGEDDDDMDALLDSLGV